MDIAAQLTRDGFVIIPRLIDEEAVQELLEAISELCESRTYGSRRLLETVPAVPQLSRSEPLMDLMRSLLGPQVRCVRAQFFDKTPEANWKVPWHQDLTIAVRERGDVPGFGPWTVKEGIPHVQPPVEILERMLAVRIHLDNCGPDNGALRVIPGSHASGRLSDDTIRQWRARVPAVTCEVPAGGALLMRPLLLHASGASQHPQHRRVVHLEYAACDLPSGLQWPNT